MPLVAPHRVYAAATDMAGAAPLRSSGKEIVNVAGEPGGGACRKGARGETSSFLRYAMWRIRAFEERVGQLTRANEVHGLVHLSTGQEAVAVGVCSQLRDDDVVYSGHRAHGHALAKGATMRAVMAELMGRDTGLCRGSVGRCTWSTAGTGSSARRGWSAATSRSRSARRSRRDSPGRTRSPSSSSATAPSRAGSSSSRSTSPPSGGCRRSSSARTTASRSSRRGRRTRWSSGSATWSRRTASHARPSTATTCTRCTRHSDGSWRKRARATAPSCSNA